jgi:hypothetical protein
VAGRGARRRAARHVSSPEAQRPVRAPVVLFAYRRHEQLARTLRCLRAGLIEKLYVFSDGPADPSAADDVELVRQLLRAIDWTEVELVEHPANLGLSRSVRSGLDRVFADHDAAVVIEDDVCVSPEFYDYACQALEHYRHEPRVAGVTGLRYPFDRRALDGYGYDVFHSPRFSSWAWATWRDRWHAFEFDPGTLRERIRASTGFEPDEAGADMAAMVLDAVVTERLAGSWDVVCATNMLLDHRLFVTPTWNMVENGGLEVGTHAHGLPSWDLAWESPPAHLGSGGVRFAPVALDERVLAGYRRFFSEGGRLTRATGALSRWRTDRRLRSASA